jgi:ribosome-associated protein
MMREDGVRIGTRVTIPLSELTFRFVRSSGPGGQNVNKVSTAVELTFDVAHSTVLTEQQKERILKGLSGKVNARGVLRLVERTSRSQWENRLMALRRFAGLLATALAERKARIPSSPSRQVSEDRLRRKRITSERKRDRRVTDSE